MITHDGLFDWMHQVPGPRDKVYSDANTAEGLVIHDAVGYLNGWYSRLFDLSKVGNRYTDNAAASVHGIYLDEIDPATGDAKTIQHYSIFKSCWASGSRYANTKFNAFETERRRGNFLKLDTPPHIERAQARTLRDLSTFRGWTPTRPIDARDTKATCWRHREMVRFGASFTECDSFRTNWPAVMALATGGVPVGDQVTKGEFGAAFAFGLETRALVIALGHGLISVAQTVAIEKAEQDKLEAAVAASEAQMENIKKMLETADG